MSTIDPSLQRYRTMRRHFEKLPADRDGTRMNTQLMEVPEEKGHFTHNCRTDSNPDTQDFMDFSSDQRKGHSKLETFVEMPGVTRGFFFPKKDNATLIHLSRDINHLPTGGYGLANVALKQIDLVTGELLSETKGDKAVLEAQKLQKQVRSRLHNIEPKGMEVAQENWLIS